MRLYEDLRPVQSRLAVVQAVVAGLIAVLLLQFWNLQVLRARHFRDLAENNRSRLVRLAAPRGTLVDREGRLLVGNRPSFNLVLTPEHAEDLDNVVSGIARTLGTGEAASGAEALKELERAELPYQLVLIDWHMPGMDGIEATRRIHASSGITSRQDVFMVLAYGRGPGHRRA